jgi:hypothetical protein
MKKIVIFLMVFLPLFVFSQSKTELKSNKVKSKTVERTEQKDGLTITYKEFYEEYDKNGRTVLQIEYSKSGEIKKKETFKYDSFGNEIEKTVYEKKSGATVKTVTKYDANGEKSEEIVYDSAGQITQKQTYTVDNKGFRKEAKEYNSKGELRWKKTYTYTGF